MATSIMYFICISILVAVLTASLILRKRPRTPKNLPPSPWKLPIIGHMHHLALAGGPPHHALRKLSHKYGALMYLQLGEIPTVVVSSPRLAKEILRTQDLAFASRGEFLFGKIIFYNATDIICAPYGEYWRQMRKICTMELLTVKRVQSFGWIRKDEGSNLIASIRAHQVGKPINLTQKLKRYNSSMVMRAALGDFSEDDQHAFLQLMEEVLSFATSFEISDLFPSLKFLHPLLTAKSKMMKVHRNMDRVLDNIIDQHSARRSSEGTDRGEDLADVLFRVKETGDLQMPFTKNNIKAVLLDLFGGGNETSSSTTEWAMAEMIKRPDVMAKAQSEVRRAFGEKRTTIEETEIQELKYLKFVVKETLRLHPPGPLLFPRESSQQCEVDGYNIPTKTRVMINVWAIGRDPEYWDDPDSFKPERFENSGVDFGGSHFEFLPFGAGRRMCPGVTFGLANVYLPLALLLYHFDWVLPDGMNPNQLDMTETVGITASRTTDLLLLPKIVHLYPSSLLRLS